MADADFGYVGGAPGKIDLYVGKVRKAKNPGIVPAVAYMKLSFVNRQGRIVIHSTEGVTKKVHKGGEHTVLKNLKKLDVMCTKDGQRYCDHTGAESQKNAGGQQGTS